MLNKLKEYMNEPVKLKHLVVVAEAMVVGHLALILLGVPYLPVAFAYILLKSVGLGFYKAWKRDSNQ